MNSKRESYFKALATFSNWWVLFSSKTDWHFISCECGFELELA